MERLPKMDDFTIEICYKILRFENMFDEPKCNWGNAPHDTEVEISDDIQRLINATNSIISINIEAVTENYSEKLLGEIKCIVTRIDSYLEKDTLRSMYNSLSTSETDSISILQDLTRVKTIEVVEFLPDSKSEKRERYSRLSMAVIDTFPKILRDVIRSIISASDLYLQCIPVLNTFYPEQQTNLKELQYSNTYSSLDVTLIYKLLREFHLIATPSQGWGAIPEKSDTKLGDDIERIRRYRNKIAHRCDTNIDTNVFDDYFDKFRDIGHRLDHYFFQKTNYEQRMIDHKTCRMDTEMQTKYENAMKDIEKIQLRFEKRPIKFYWRESFDKCLMNLRSLLKDEQLDGRQKVRVQIIFQNEEDVERNISILNSLREEINEDLSGIEFIVTTKGSLVLNVDILLELFETDEQLQTTLALFLEKIVERITAFTTDTIDMVLLPVEEYTQLNVSKTFEEPVYLDFDMNAGLFETDLEIEEQLRKISDAITKHSNGSGIKNDITATLLPICLENITTTEKGFAQAQTPVKYNFPISATLLRTNILKLSANYTCVKISNTLVLSEYFEDLLLICCSNGTNIHQIPLPYMTDYITVVNSNTVAVTCSGHYTILLINISTCKVTSTIKTKGDCWGISYYDNNLYVIFDEIMIHVMDLTGKVIRTIPIPTDSISDITVHRDRLVCLNTTSVYCCLFNGKLMWKFENDKHKSFRRVTTDDERNVYITSKSTNTVVVVSDDGKHYSELLTESDGMNDPYGIHFDKKDNILMVSNFLDGNIFLFHIKKKHT